MLNENFSIFVGLLLPSNDILIKKKNLKMEKNKLR